MPIYEYKCEKCNEIIEEIQKFSDPPLTECKKCRGKLKKLISSKVGFDFKGTGFYITDYQKKEEEQKRKREEKTKGKEETTKESKSEEKKETSTETKIAETKSENKKEYSKSDSKTNS